MLPCTVLPCRSPCGKSSPESETRFTTHCVALKCFLSDKSYITGPRAPQSTSAGDCDLVMDRLMKKKKPPVKFPPEALRRINFYLVTRAAVATAAIAAAIFAGLGFVNLQRTSAQVFTIELRDSSSAFFLGLHLDKTK